MEYAADDSVSTARLRLLDRVRELYASSTIVCARNNRISAGSGATSFIMINGTPAT